MKKSKAEGRLALLEGNNAQASPSLAHHNLQSSSPLEFAAIEDGGNGAANYMQLRSREVEKPSAVVAYEKMQKGCKRYSDSESKGKKSTKMENEDDEMDVEEDSFAEKIIEGGERITRESTPLNLVRNPDAIRTSPSSSIRLPSTTSTSNANSMRQYMPTSDEVNEIFLCEEEEQRKKFIEKYNFDPANEEPLPGRYHWEKLEP